MGGGGGGGGGDLELVLYVDEFACLLLVDL